MIEIHGEGGKIGEVSLEDGKVTASTPAVQDIADRMLRRHGSPQEAFRALAGLDNGYIWAQAPGSSHASEDGEAVLLAKAVSGTAKAATTAHLLETTLHELAHARRHAQAMTQDTPDAEWEFNADHAEKHIGGAAEHAGKLAQHLKDNYPDVAKWLNGLGETVPPGGEGGGKQEAEPQHARYGKDGGETITAQMANGETTAGQLGGG